MKKRWRDFTPGQQGAIVVASAVEIVLTTMALVDLARRPGATVRGPRFVWAAICFVQPIGPLAYMLFGRRKVVAGPAGT